ncbi:hypothetical protein RHOFW510R12_00175 [Rhodanobacter sp. FW510-R12]|uniref:DUF2478 domain-containing protein n=1 Tax=unclassified Rhodanobacter TaxID=2621553 RepID=UPI0007A9A6DC|nr:MULTISPECIES: DUF2478 domain-containing protein [unclassified Rhodanobacter]KZC15592.1 hypothetical protein RHOFW104R8_04070 [Rhodanobacter sp. FW104-R8]KZC28321.1 hypothetical protein RhoFW510T8_11730 [Rhodanobacter sp. FW510-T8]KZC32696.1 hypothetical protein RhoFW510R10_11250 [Rhodanobacter sp. FW510-R10]
MNPYPSTHIAAIVYTERRVVDGLLADFTECLRQRQRRILGLLQQYAGESEQKLLVDIDTGERFPLSQDLGPGSRSCGLDPCGIAAASAVLRRALAIDSELVIVNRFGVMEVAGGGFAAELLALMSEEVPVLTAVAERHLVHWRSFSGHAALELPPRLDALELWFDRLAPIASATSP